MEAFLFSLGAPITKTIVGGVYDLKSQLLFLAVMMVYTFVYLYYRCKVKTENKPDVSVKKAFGAMTPFIIYIIVIIGLQFALQYTFNPLLLMGYTLGTTTIAVWIISFFIYYPAVRLSHGDCFPSVFSSIGGFLKSLVS